MRLLRRFLPIILCTLFTTGCLENLFSGNDDSSIYNLDSETSNSNSATGDSEIQSSSSSEDGSSDSIDTGDTELDSEGFATLPVTPPKAEIDALGLSAASSSTSGALSHDLFINNAYAGDDDGVFCYINGSAGTVEGNSVVNAGLLESDDTLFSFTAAEDGSFAGEVPNELSGETLWLRYEDISGAAQNISMHISHDCTTYVVGISGANAQIQGEILVHNSSVFYNSLQDDGSNKLMVQDLSGSEASVFATLDTEIFQMFYTPGISPDDDSAHPFIVALDSSLNLLRIDQTGGAQLNDYKDGETMENGAVFEIEGVNHVPSKSRAFSVYFGLAPEEGGTVSDSGNAAMLLIPTIPTAQDHPINNPSFHDITNRTMDWIDDDQLLCLNQRLVSQSSTSESSDQSQQVTTIEIFNLSSVTQLTPEELEEADFTQDIGMQAPTSVFLTTETLVMPKTFKYGPDKLAYYLFSVNNSGGIQVGLSDFTTKAKIIAGVEGDAVWKSVTPSGDLMAAEIKRYDPQTESYTWNILLVYLPTMDTFWLVNPDEFDDTMALHKPVFATDQEHVLTYQIEYKDQTTEIGVLNLDLHPVISGWFQKSGTLTNLDHIFSNENYQTIALTEAPIDESPSLTDTDKDDDVE